MEFCLNFGCQIYQFFDKKTIVLQNSWIKSRICTRKEHKNFSEFL